MVSRLCAVLITLLMGHGTAAARDLDAGIAFTDPALMKELDDKGFSLGAFLKPGWQRNAPAPVLDNRQLSTLPAMRNILRATNMRLNTCRSRGQTIGVGMSCLKRMFDQRYLYANFARFELVGVINRMDRAWVKSLPCGEVRLLYRLAYATTTSEGPTKSRLPMSLNLVLKALPDNSILTCRQIARRWIEAGNSAGGQSRLPLRQLAAKLMAGDGILSTVTPDAIDRIETNIQSTRQPSAMVPEFGGNAEYLLSVFRLNRSTGAFDKQLMENQIDRDRLLSDRALLDRLKSWLLEPAQLKHLDAGTIEIPKEYLATNAISVAPGGASRSINRPFDGLISDEEAAAALERAKRAGTTFKNISSAFGFQRRANDITCVGCHQSRAIGGFHFMGADRRENLDELPANAIFVPASAHFYGEAPRRRAIVEAFAAGRTPDYLRGFSARPRKSLAAGLAGTGILNGWSATCYTGSDPSFKPWTCDAGLECKTLHAADADQGMGLCVTKGGLKVGDPVELGDVRTVRYGVDTFERRTPPPGAALTPPHVRLDTARMAAAPQAGGFFGGMVRTRSCSNLPKEAVCARSAGDGFNECLGAGHNFERCVLQHTKMEGLRACDQTNPCRDDYVCVATALRGRGACLPPYFLFQFRVDGHPVNF